ncbi:MAG: TIGR03435 family protein [Acidobacteria bacterium]|nr:TIGR03435 family protein [Acidobacteriota bacterium]
MAHVDRRRLWPARRSYIRGPALPGRPMRGAPSQAVALPYPRFVRRRWTRLRSRFVEFAPDMPVGSVPLNGMPQPPLATAAGPSVFTAVQEQLGLRLAADKAPLKVIVVDSVERPSTN